MVNRIGIIFKDNKWAIDKFDEIVSLIPLQKIQYMQRKADRCICRLYNGDQVETLKGLENNLRELRFSRCIVQEELKVDDRILNVAYIATIPRNTLGIYD